jgi:uncharacterized protein (DUF885 family)
MRRFLFLAALTAASCSTMRQTPSQQLAAIAEEHWQRQLASDVLTRSEIGLPLEHLPDLSYAQVRRDADAARASLAKLSRIDASSLTDEERLSLAILRHDDQLKIDGEPHFWLRFLVTPYGSPIRSVQNAMLRQQFKTTADTGRYLRLLREYARLVDQITEVTLEQQRRGILLPKRELPLIKPLLATDVLVVDKSRLDSIPAGERAIFFDAMRNAVTLDVGPAVSRLKNVFSKDYVAAAPETTGIGQYPGGADAYRYLIRYHTSFDLDPKELHEQGLRELERIDRALATTREQMGFTGPPREFYAFVQRYWTSRGAFKDPFTYFATYVYRISTHLDRLFSRQPHANYDVRRLAPSLEQSMTFGYYQPPTAADPMGHYYYNASPAKPGCILFGAALMAHELMPGHHFQMVRQIESEDLPLWRRHREDTGYTEGWGDYAAELGEEMGLYDAPPDRAARLFMDSMISSRLVADTGLNAMGWSWDQAVRFMQDHTSLSDSEIESELLRYSVDIPAQALAYKVGSLKIVELRRQAEKDLGAAFDIREFHEWMLRSGSVPLSLKQLSAGPAAPASASK